MITSKEIQHYIDNDFKSAYGELDLISNIKSNNFTRLTATASPLLKALMDHVAADILTPLIFNYIDDQLRLYDLGEFITDIKKMDGSGKRQIGKTTATTERHTEICEHINKHKPDSKLKEQHKYLVETWDSLGFNSECIGEQQLRKIMNKK